MFNFTFQTKIQTYLAAGKPIIASIDGEGARVINDAGAGLASPSDDPQKLADNILKIYKMKKFDRIKTELNGRRYYENNF